MAACAISRDCLYFMSDVAKVMANQDRFCWKIQIWLTLSETNGKKDEFLTISAEIFNSVEEISILTTNALKSPVEETRNALSEAIKQVKGLICKIIPIEVVISSSVS